MSKAGPGGLPARLGSFPGSPDARLRRVHSLKRDILPAMGVSIAPAEAGQVTVCLPAEVAELFLLDLEQRGQEWQEAMRKARILEMRRAAELDTASGASLRAFQATQDGWAEEYQTLRTNGKGHREALNIIPGPKERDAITVTDVELGIQAAMGRRGAGAARYETPTSFGSQVRAARGRRLPMRWAYGTRSFWRS